jgi:hypothetical protein
VQVRAKRTALPVFDGSDRYVGLVPVAALEDADPGRRVADLIVDGVPIVSEDAPARDAAETLERAPVACLAVAAAAAHEHEQEGPPEGPLQIVGTLEAGDVLARYARMLREDRRASRHLNVPMPPMLRALSDAPGTARRR